MRAFLVFALAAVAAAQPLAYKQLATGGPSPRLDGTIAYDPSGSQLFLFGGSDGATKNDLWAYSLSNGRWAELNTNPRPAARLGHTLNFDPVRRRLILFAGQASGFFSDVWAFDIATARWTQLARDQAGPSNRYGHSAIYDAPRDRLVISHGFTDSGRFDDTWAFDLRTNSWRNISPSSGRPLRRCLHHAVHDGASTMFLYGGCASGFGPCPLGDLWAFDLSTNRWTEVAAGAPLPPARQHYGVTFDESRRRLVLFGGSGGRGSLNDTWEFDPAAGRWQTASLNGPTPSPRSRHQGAFAADRTANFFFGGSTDSGLSNELWSLGPATQTTPAIAAARNTFSGAGEAVAPGELVSLYGASLGPADGVAATLDGAGRLSGTLSGVAVTFDGVAAPLLFARQDQLNTQVPYEVAGRNETRIEVTVNGASATLTVPLRPTHPGLFPTAFHADGQPVTETAPARPGEILLFFATGQGVTSPASRTGYAAAETYPAPAAPVRLTVASRPAELLFTGQAPGTVGVMQINAKLPDDASGLLDVILRVGDGESRTTVPVRGSLQ